MSIIRIKKRENPFVQIDKRPLENKRLSWKAKGLFAYLMSKPDDWEINVSHLKKQSIDGRDSVTTGINELLEHGYMKRVRLHKSDGTFDGFEYILFEEPTIDTEQVRERPSDTINGKSVNGLSVNGLTVNGESVTTNNDNTNNEVSDSPQIKCLKNETAFDFPLKGLEVKDYPLDPLLDSENAEAIMLCKYARFTIWFYQKLEPNYGHYHHMQNATLEKWMGHVRLMHENDNLTWDLMKKIAKYALTNSWWSDKILSTQNFRDKVKKGTLRQSYEREVLKPKTEVNNEQKETRTDTFVRRSKGILD